MRFQIKNIFLSSLKESEMQQPQKFAIELRKATNVLRSCAVGLGMCSMFAGAVTAQATTLSLSGIFTPTQPMVAQGEVVFMDAVEKATNGKVKFKYYPGEQLGKAKDMPDALKNGLVDISAVAPAYSSEKFPLSGVAELPGMFEKVCKGVAAMIPLAEPGGVIYEKELKPNGVRMLAVFFNDPYKIMTAKKTNAKSLADLKGLKIRTAGGAMDLLARSLDASPVRMAGPDVLVALQRGTLDGLLWPILSVRPWGVEGPLTAWISNVSVGSFVGYLLISDTAWNKLDKDTQDALVDAGRKTSEHACKFMDSSIDMEIPKLIDAAMEPVELPAEDVKAIEGKFDDIQTQWATGLDKQGKAGTEVLNAYRAGLQ